MSDFLGAAQMLQRRFSCILGLSEFLLLAEQCGLCALALRYFFRRNVDAHDIARRPSQRMPIGYPISILVPIGALSGDLDAGHGFSSLHDRTDDLLDRCRERRHTFANRTTQMALNRDAADFGEALVDMQIATIRRKECEADRRCIVNQLQSRLRELQDALRRQAGNPFTPDQLRPPQRRAATRGQTTALAPRMRTAATPNPSG